MPKPEPLTDADLQAMIERARRDDVPDDIGNDVGRLIVEISRLRRAVDQAANVATWGIRNGISAEYIGEDIRSLKG